MYDAYVARVIAAGALASVLLALPGCTVTTTPDSQYPPVYVSNAPPNVETYPTAYYQGRQHYWVNGTWYYRTNRGWATYRRAPPELERQHPNVQQPPPRREQPEYRR
ncbi:MAG TPA: hypothetical protein VNO21_25380 [Polyangiaceae bacterium]|nr:hypothetical protein [Polyangiaceae bacterium]